MIPSKPSAIKVLSFSKVSISLGIEDEPFGASDFADQLLFGWRRDQNGPKWGLGFTKDFILAADVVYFEEQDPLVDALKAELTVEPEEKPFLFLGYIII